MENGGKDCFDVCKKQGRCDWCGMDGWCCRKDRVGNGCDGTFGGLNHQCVLKPGKLSNITVLKYFFAKLSGIGKINSCKGHQCDSADMVVRLSDIRPKTGKKCIACWFPFEGF